MAKSESRQAQFISDPYGFNRILHESIESARNQHRDAKVLYAVPQEAAVEFPAIRTYKYMMVNDRVVLVDPATSEVVAEFAE